MTLFIPRGFYPSCEVVNILSTSDDILQQYITLSSQKNVDAVTKETLFQTTASQKDKNILSLTPQQLQSAFDVLHHIFTSLPLQTTKISDITTILTQKTTFSPTIQKLIIAQYEQAQAPQPDTQSSANTLTSSSFNIGRLVDTKWKLGLAVCSDDCERLHTPFVSLGLTIDELHTQRTENMELSLADFVRLSRDLKELEHALQEASTSATQI